MSTQQESQESASGQPKLRFVAADDNRDAADLLAVLLSMDGHEVHTAYDGLQAYEAADKQRPEVVLLDLGMPGLNGYETCRRIRAQDWGAAMILVALTGWGQDEDKRRTQEAGFDAHLVKPVDYAALQALLVEVRLKRST